MTIEEHYQTLAPRLTNWLVATGTPYNTACDLVQETFVKLWKMRDDLRDNDAAVSGLVFTIARNLRKNLARDDRRLVFQEEIREEDAGTTSGAPPTSSDDVAFLRNRLLLRQMFLKAQLSMPQNLQRRMRRSPQGTRQR